MLTFNPSTQEVGPDLVCIVNSRLGKPVSKYQRQIMKKKIVAFESPQINLINFYQ